MIKVTKDNKELLELLQAAAEIFNGSEGALSGSQLKVLTCDVVRLERALDEFDFPRATAHEYEEAVSA